MPLHIFEPRYRQMVADSLAGEKCLAVLTDRDSPGAFVDRIASVVVKEVEWIEGVQSDRPDGTEECDIIRGIQV